MKIAKETRTRGVTIIELELIEIAFCPRVEAKCRSRVIPAKVTSFTRKRDRRTDGPVVCFFWILEPKTSLYKFNLFSLEEEDDLAPFRHKKNFN